MNGAANTEKASQDASPVVGASSPVSNRVVFVLSLLGLLVAGYLWWLHAADLDIPCGGSGDCNAVAASPYSRFPPGAGLPVAAYGTLCYLVLATLAVLRTLQDEPRRNRRLLGAILVLSLAGTLFSLWLTGLELFVIHKICRWCIASQMLILAIFLTAAWEWVRLRRA